MVNKIKTFLEFIKKIFIQASIAALVGVVLGIIYALIKRNVGFLQGVNLFLYIVGLALIFYAVAPIDEVTKMDKDKKTTFTREEAEEILKKRAKLRKQRVIDVFRALLTLLYAIILESIRFYLL